MKETARIGFSHDPAQWAKYRGKRNPAEDPGSGEHPAPWDISEEISRVLHWDHWPQVVIPTLSLASSFLSAKTSYLASLIHLSLSRCLSALLLLSVEVKVQVNFRNSSR